MNNAPEVKRLANGYMKEFTKVNEEFIVIHEGEFTKSLGNGIEKDYCFSSYFKKNYDNPFISNDLLQFDHWASFYPDFEREEHFKSLKNDKEYYEKLIINLYNFFYHIFNEEKITHIVYENISNSFAFTAYNVASLFNIKYIGLIYSRLPGRFEILSSLFGVNMEYLESYNKSLESSFVYSNS